MLVELLPLLFRPSLSFGVLHFLPFILFCYALTAASFPELFFWKSQGMTLSQGRSKHPRCGSQPYANCFRYQLLLCWMDCPLVGFVNPCVTYTVLSWVQKWDNQIIRSYPDVEDEDDARGQPMQCCRRARVEDTVWCCIISKFQSASHHRFFRNPAILNNFRFPWAEFNYNWTEKSKYE